MRVRYNIMLDPDKVEVIDNIRGLISRSSYLNNMLGEEIERVNSSKQTIDIIDRNQAIQTEIERLITSLKNHHNSITEIRKFIKTSLLIINKDCIEEGVQPLTLKELSEMLQKEAESRGIRCIQ